MKTSSILLLSFVSCVFCYNADGTFLRIGNPDDTEQIWRPCPVYDWNCIREFFSSHAHCTKTFGPAPDPAVRIQENFEVSFVNMSFTLSNTEVRGLNGRIEEFYVNKDTNNVVFSVEFRNLNLTSGGDNLERGRAYLQFHRRGKEPIIFPAYGEFFYEDLIITAIIPNANDMKLDQAECTTFSKINPRVIVIPNQASDDPLVAVALAEILTNIRLTVQQLYITDSAYYLAMFIQYNICDFGLLVN